MRNYNDYNDYYENDYLCHWRPKGSKNGYHDPRLRQQSAKAYRDGENTKGFDRSKVKKKNGILDALGETKIGKAIGAGAELAKRVPFGDIATFEKDRLNDFKDSFNVSEEDRELERREREETQRDFEKAARERQATGKSYNSEPILDVKVPDAVHTYLKNFSKYGSDPLAALIDTVASSVIKQPVKEADADVVNNLLNKSYKKSGILF